MLMGALFLLTHHMRYQGYLEAMNHHGLQPWSTDAFSLRVKPKIEISDAQIENNSLSFSVYRVEGVDV